VIEGEKISGGRFINNLRHCPKIPFSDQLASITLRHSRCWISKAVKYRDILAHNSNLDDMTHLSLPLRHEFPHIRSEEIIEPKMPNGESLEQYFSNLRENLIEYTRQSIVLAPKVELGLIYPEKLGN
jgi:hypothetical protein